MATAGQPLMVFISSDTLVETFLLSLDIARASLFLLSHRAANLLGMYSHEYDHDM
jgi:hypothetical protein